MEDTAIDGDEESLYKLKHDIKNQLSNIILAQSQLEYELTDLTDDQQYYLKTITDSCKQINAIIDKA
jgi:signal transduction histidine kinase